jgi:cation diffusion facilitator family transporter
MAGSSKKAIYAALAGNSLIAITKFAAAAYSGSSAMFSEGIHSLVDTGNQILLLHGLKRAEKPANAEFPLGYGKEIYFWSFVVAILIFALGGGISIYQGWQHLSHPEPMQNILVNYLVLGAAIVFEAGALWVAFREFNASRGDRGLFEAVRGGKDPSLFVVVFEDTAALLGLLIALAGLALFQLTGNMIFDGLASIGIGVVLVVTATWLAYESKGLLIGEAADPRIVARIREILAAQEYIANTNEVTTVHMGPSQIIVMLSVDFIDGLDSSVVESTVTRINHRIKAIDPAIRRVFVEVERAADHSR